MVELQTSILSELDVCHILNISETLSGRNLLYGCDRYFLKSTLYYWHFEKLGILSRGSYLIFEVIQQTPDL